MEENNKIDKLLEEIIQFCQEEWGLFTEKDFDGHYGVSTRATYEIFLEDFKESLRPILKKYIKEYNLKLLSKNENLLHKVFSRRKV